MQNTDLAYIQETYADDIERLILDASNGYSFSMVTYIYSRLKELGPWKPSDFSMEMILEIDMMHSALVVTYGRIFADGARKVSRDKVPTHLRQIHDQIMELRNQRYAHNDAHASIDLGARFEEDGETIEFHPSINMQMTLGAPAEWQELFDWLGEYLVEQSGKQLDRLSELTGKQWVQPKGPPPDWIADEQDGTY